MKLTYKNKARWAQKQWSFRASHRRRTWSQFPYGADALQETISALESLNLHIVIVVTGGGNGIGRNKHRFVVTKPSPGYHFLCIHHTRRLMQTQIKKWGNSLALRIPRALADQLVLTPPSYNGKVGLAILCPITNQEKGFPFEVRIPRSAE
jgi:hypothetical protein